MSKIIRISDETFDRLKSWVPQPEVFSMRPNDVVSLVLDVAEDYIVEVLIDSKHKH